MDTKFPSASHVAGQLRELRMNQLQDLAARSGVPFRTLLKIRLGQTPNPGLETVRKFYALLPDAVVAAPVTEQPTQGVVNA